MESRRHSCRSVHLTDSWTLSKTVHFGRLRSTAEAKGTVMESRYLPGKDSCTCIRQKRPEEVLRRFRKLRPGKAAISVITCGELPYDASKSASDR